MRNGDECERERYALLLIRHWIHRFVFIENGTQCVCLVHFEMLKHSYSTIFNVFTVFIVIIVVIVAAAAAAFAVTVAVAAFDIAVQMATLECFYTFCMQEKEHNCSIIELYGE